MNATVAPCLAAWASGLEPSAHDVELADRALLDTVAVAVAAREHPIRSVASRLERAGRWATIAHVLDFDDLHMRSTAHLSTVCVPVALATGGGARAYLAGAGVMARLGAALGWEHYSAGWHATTTTGALGAAVVAGTARGLDADQLACAMALAVPAAGGVQAAFGTDGKSLQVGLAADAGVRAVDLVAAGATADPHAVDDWMLLLGGDPARLDLDGEAVPGGLAIKLHPACYAVQRPIAGIRDALNGTRVDTDDIVEVSVRTPPATVAPLIHRRPVTGLQGKFSLEYAVASALLDGEPGLVEFTDEAVRRPEAQALLRRVSPDLVGDGDWLLAGELQIQIRTATETHEARVELPPGSPGRPPTRAELESKLAGCFEGTGWSSADVDWSTAGALLDAALA